MARIIFDNVTFSYPGQRPIFDTLNLRLASDEGRGNIVALVGASGSGKTTLLRLLAGILKCNKGRIGIEPDDCAFAYVPQEVVLFEHLTIEQNLRFFRRIKAQRSRYDNDAVNRLAALLRIDHLLDNKRTVNKLSGGERQRVALVRSLALHPNILLLDEPCAGLDSPLKTEILRELKQVVDSQGILAVYASHYLSELAIVADYVLYISPPADGAIESITHTSVGKFMNCPPNVECARTLVGPAANVLSCISDGSVVRIAGNRIAVCRCSSQNDIPFGDCLLVFGPEALLASSKGPIVPVQVTASDRSWFIEFPGEETWLISQRHGSVVPRAFELSGSAFLFCHDGTSPGVRVSLDRNTM